MVPIVSWLIWACCIAFRCSSITSFAKSKVWEALYLKPMKRTVVRYEVVEFGSYGSKPNFLLLICTKLLTSDLLKMVKAIGRQHPKGCYRLWDPPSAPRGLGAQNSARAWLDLFGPHLFLEPGIRRDLQPLLRRTSSRRRASLKGKFRNQERW